MTIRAPFQGIRGANQVVTPAATSAAVTLTKDGALAKSVRLVNSGANICYVRVGTATSAATATTADTPIRAGSDLIVQKAEGEDTVAHISATGTTLNIQPGEGGV
jgi:hypothetical protein